MFSLTIVSLIKLHVGIVGRPMPVFIDSVRVVEIGAIASALIVEMTLKQAEIVANDGLPVEWTLDERKEVIKAATLLAYLSECDVACYPVSVASVVFFP